MRGGGRGAARGVVATALLASIALLGASCGGTDFASRNLEPVRTAVSVPASVTTVRNPTLQAQARRAVPSTRAAGTARTTISVTLTGLAGGSIASSEFDIAGTGVVDLRSGNATLLLSVPRFDRAGGLGTVNQRIVGGVEYVGPPDIVLQAAGLDPPVHWLSLDAARSTGSDAAALAQAEVDPAALVALLGAVSDNVRRIGADAVRGVPTVHDAATIDLPASSLGAVPAHRSSVSSVSSTAVSGRLAALRSVVGAVRLVVESWVDADGRVRRVVVSVPLSMFARTLHAAVAGSPAMMRIQVDLYAFGTPVSVVAPPAAQVRPFSTFRLARANR